MSATAAQVELIAGLEQQRLMASRDSNVSELTKLLHDDFVFVHSNGRILSRADYLKLLGSGKLRYETMEGFDVVVTGAGSRLATVRSRIEFVAHYRGRRVSVSALTLALWLRGRAGWQALCVQSSDTQARPE